MAKQQSYDTVIEASPYKIQIAEHNMPERVMLCYNVDTTQETWKFDYTYVYEYNIHDRWISVGDTVIPLKRKLGLMFRTKRETIINYNS